MAQADHRANRGVSPALLAGWLLTPLHLVAFVVILVVFHPAQVCARRLGYGAHKATVDLLNLSLLASLRLVGARDRWISGAFVLRFTLRALCGAAVGAVGATIVVMLLPGGAEAGILNGLGFRGVEWLLPVLVPVVAALIAALATYVATARTLRSSR